MSFSGNLLQLDLLSAFSHQQLKTIEDVLLSSSISQASSFTNFQSSHSFVCANNNNTPTWSKSESAHVDQLDQVTTTTTMNNLPKIQSPATTGGNAAPAATVSGGGGPVPAPGGNNQFSEYLAMQQQAQQMHQQQTQQQNQALAAGHFLGNRPFESHSQLLQRAAAAGALKPLMSSGGPPVPPLAISSSSPVPTPAAMHLTHSAGVTTGGPAMAGQHQKQPLALTSNMGRSPPVQVQVPVQAAPPPPPVQPVQGAQSLVKEQVSIVHAPPPPPQLISVSGNEQATGVGNLHTVRKQNSKL